MKLGLQIPNLTFPGGPSQLAQHLVEIARTAEDAGFASVWVMDHFFQIPPVGPAEREMLEGYSALAFLAGVTRRVQLGTLVTGVTYRHPGVLVKGVTSLDVLSGGRAYLGIGAAWFEREHRGLGVPFPPLRERFERLEETLQIALQMWSGDTAPFQGRHYQLTETLCSPPPLTSPRPPILIGGLGEQRTLRLVARYGDACNLFTRIGHDELRRKLQVLRRHCDDVGRDYAEIERTTLGTLHLAPGTQSEDDALRECEALAGLGVQHAIFNLPNVHELKPLEVLGRQVIPRIAAL